VGETLASPQTQRKEWLDALRGLAIFLVVLIHNVPSGAEKGVFVILTGPIKIPLFFAISGYVFNIHNGKQGKFFLNLLRKILLPSLFLFIGLRIIRIPKNGFEYLWDGLVGFFAGKNCWYISACIIAETLFFYILKFCKKEWQIITVVFLCSFFGFVMSIFRIGDVAMINRAFVVQPFLLMGYLFRKHEDFFKKLHWSVLAGGFLAVAAMIGLTFLIWPNRGIDVHMNNYYGRIETIPFCFLLIALFTLSLMTLGTKLGKLCKPLAIVGQHTMVIYILNGFFLGVGNRILPLEGLSGILLNVKYLLIPIFSITVCTLGGMLLNWLCPEIMGRRRKKKAIIK
jgi:fucose 4-O-acetylase-like acetyltransferase